MAVSRTQLQAHLDLLDSSIPGLLDSQGDFFIEAFAAMAEAISEQAAPGPDRDWVEDEAIAILERRGLVVTVQDDQLTTST